MQSPSFLSTRALSTNFSPLACSPNAILTQKPAHSRQGIAWTSEENELLKVLVGEHGTRNWKQIAAALGKTAIQCAQHWQRVMNPNITKGKWSEEEDKALIEAVKQSPPKQWKQIANKMQGRTDTQVRYRLLKLKDSLIDYVGQEYLP
ncbi:Myb-like_DNA-binding domain-containing protein [Hexamita inflata]|uniref:Myb-like DNA-binding domain-containing protein n=1 Tax=Hexamita inflata TaxID=28002 RepID=A0AA86QIS4_9EUKA|nr:Myb-like DNA-binding domain-containing protein [Hexamita inflata]CAI9959063.1 Myb-like DNA-binding domain-containing protein [Hexamita inflata]CAI9964598.1 Myb-like DNA-binding domain-containing protein [Hexamita inflata]